MIQFYAPWPQVENIIFLPDPDFGDGRRPLSTFQLKESMNGKLYTYVSRAPQRQTYTLTFNLTRQKSLELYNFYKNYGGQKWLFVNYDETVHIGILSVNPLVLIPSRRGHTCDNEETILVDLEFEVTGA